MDPLTINTNNIQLLSSDGTNVPIKITMNTGSTIATVTVNAPCASETSYTLYANLANIKTSQGVAAGNGNTAITTFTTGDYIAPEVSLVTPADEEGNVSKTPSIVIQFSEPMNPLTLTSSNISLEAANGDQIPLTLLAVDNTNTTAIFTLSSGSLNSETTYNITIIPAAIKDAAGNPVGAANSATTITSFTTGDTVQPTIANVEPENAATNLSITPALSIHFSEAMNPTTLTANNITLVSLANGTNVPLKVLNVNPDNNLVELGLDSGQLQSQSAYQLVINPGAITDANGNPISQGQSQIVSTFTTGDVAGPRIIAVTPGNGATNIGQKTGITIQFSEPMDSLTLNSTNIVLQSTDGTIIPTSELSISQDQTSVAFTTSSTLSANTSYKIVVNEPAIKDVANNPLGENTSATLSTFTTGDYVAPEIIAVTPTNGSINQNGSTNLVVFFNEAIDPATLNSATILVQEFAGSAIQPTDYTIDLSLDGKVATISFKPNVLTANTYYQLILIGANITDLAGNKLGAASIIATTFATGNDMTSPTWMLVTPSPITNVALNVKPQIRFSELMDTASVTNGVNIYLNDDTANTRVPANYECSGKNPGECELLTIIPAANLNEQHTYAVVVTGGTDLEGNKIAELGAARFDTGDFTAPQVLATFPGNISTNNNLDAIVTLTFNEDMDASTIDEDSFYIDGVSSTNYTITYDPVAKTAALTFKNGFKLAEESTYTVRYTDDIKDINGNNLDAGSFSFTTGDFTAPQIITASISPANGSTANAPFTTINIPLNEEIIVGANMFTVKNNVTGAILPYTIVMNGYVLTLTLDDAIAASGLTSFSVSVDQTKVVDANGNKMGNDTNAPVTTFFVKEPL